MNHKLRQQADAIVAACIHDVLPDHAVQQALSQHDFGTGKVVLVAAGKAAWQMAHAADAIMGKRICAGVVITKYGHIMGPIANYQCFEGGHPVPDAGSFRGTEAALSLVSGLNPEDTVLFLLSGGGSALFENPLISAPELALITKDLLACGADIVEINTIRKRLSGVKGGRFAACCAPAKVYGIILSDILGDPVDMIASGPISPDASTCMQAYAIKDKYGLTFSKEALTLLGQETPKQLDNVEITINGSVRALCTAAAKAVSALGYEPIILTDQLCCQAREAGSFLASILKTHLSDHKKLAFIAGGETIVKLTGQGKGGRNQELALAAADGIAGLPAAVFSIGSDGTDGPTDAAGGYVDGDSAAELLARGLHIYHILQDNDAYPALKQIDGLIFTGPTGTNVNDVAVALLDPAE